MSSIRKARWIFAGYGNASGAIATDAGGGAVWRGTIGILKPRARPLAYEVLYESGISAVNPSWLLAMMWIVPPVSYPRRRLRFSVSATIPCPGNAASPWIRIGTLLAGSNFGAPAAPVLVPAARAMPSTTGSTASRWLGFGG